MATFRKVRLSIKRGNGYGQYVICAYYKGMDLRVVTTNSECFNWLNDDSNKEKHREAKIYAYDSIVMEYQNQHRELTFIVYT